ncbi:hypothetical protein SprV_0200588600 [Sparganum proliferum]
MKYKNSTALIFGRQGPFSGTNSNHTPSKDGRFSPDCQSKDTICQFRLTKRAFAVILPTEMSLVPLEVSAKGVFDFLLWNLNAHSDALSVVPVTINSSEEMLHILKRQAQHFRNVLNHPSKISAAAIDRLSQVEINADLDLPSSLPKANRAGQQISSGKASGSDAIPAEIYKHTSHRPVSYQGMCRCGQVPPDLKDTTLIHFCKHKGNRQVYDHHSGILLLNNAGNIFVRTLLNLLHRHLGHGLRLEGNLVSDDNDALQT